MESIGQVLHPEEDSLSLSLLRARATRLMLSVVRTCNPYNAEGLVCVCLCLLDEPESTQVTIARSPSPATPDEVLGQVSYDITATPSWIESCSDDEFCAIMAHEIGHAANGDLQLRPLPVWMRWPFIATPLMHVLLGSSLSILAVGSTRVAFSLLAAVLVLAIYLALVSGLYAHRIRVSEYKADAFAVRFGFARDLLFDLQREWQQLDWHDIIYAHSPFAQHPTYQRRRRAVLRLSKDAP